MNLLVSFRVPGSAGLMLTVAVVAVVVAVAVAVAVTMAVTLAVRVKAAVAVAVINRRFKLVGQGYG